MKKKLITTLTMSILMIFATANTTFAATQLKTQDVQPQKSDNKTPTTGDVQILANVESGYLIEIPAVIDFGRIRKGGDAGAFEVSMKLRQKNGIKDVLVSTASDNDFKLYHQITSRVDDIDYIDPNKDAAIGFTFTANGSSIPAAKGDTIGTLDTEETPVSMGDVKIDTSNIAKGGDYKGTIKFEFTGEEA